MKVNVKGLVFVGFAAAILSAGAAQATDDNAKIVTSKAFTEATYQAKTAANNSGKVLKMASNDAGDIGYMTVDTTVAANSDNLVTSGAVATAIANEGVGNKQGKSSANFQVGGANGAWNQIGTDSYVNVAAGTGDNVNKAMFTINATTDGTLPAVDSAKLVTAGAVKTYADGKIAAAITDGDTTHAPSGDAVNDALALKQAAATAVKYDGTTAVGSTTQPVYVDANGDVTALSYTIQTSVPANAVFTDTTYDVMSAATDLAAGASGLVPAPAAGDNTKFLNGAGQWATPENTTYNTLTAAEVTTGTDTTGKLVTAKILRDELDAKQNASTAVTFDGTNPTGSATQPVYIAADGTATATTYALNKTVPADAVFTDTTYGADSTTITLTGTTFSATTGNVASNNNGLVTGATVYNYISALPAVNVPASCTDAAPCALVATTSGAAWVAMSQPSAQ